MKVIAPPTLVLSLALMSSASHAAQVPGPLVDTAWLAANADKVAILAVRADIRSFSAKPVYMVDKKTRKKRLVRLAGHIPGARLVNYKKIRATRVIGGNKITKMLPGKASFAALLQAAGVNNDSAVVIVTKGLSAGDMTIATRMYWQMKYFGHDNVAILNGGLAQWMADGRAVSSDVPAPAKGSWTAQAERKELLATSEEVALASKTGSAVLVDNRPLDQYFGLWRKSYVYDKGHIPTAKILPTNIITRAGGPVKFLSAPELRNVVAQMKIKSDGPAITYCNSGHLASGGWFVLHELLGNKTVKLYDGSMHQWTMEKRPTTAMKME